MYLEPARMVSVNTGASVIASVVSANKPVIGVGVYNVTNQPIHIYKHTTLSVLPVLHLEPARPPGTATFLPGGQLFGVARPAYRLKFLAMVKICF